MKSTRLALLPEVVITDHDTCGEVLRTGEAYDDAEEVTIRGPFPHVLSIVGTWPDSDPPGGWEVWNAYGAKKLRLVFDDVMRTTPHHGDAPTEEHVKAIFEFADKLAPGKEGRTIIHCAAGISRSTGATLAIFMRILGAGNEKLAIRALLKIKKTLRPHRGITRMVDEQLGLEGRLIAAHMDVWGKAEFQ
jgi:predicted protein tyrosine phosphatase